MIPFVKDDGGRAAVGFRGEAGDCAVRAIAIATGRPYKMIYDGINVYALHERPRGGKRRSNARTGVWPQTVTRLLDPLEWEWTPTMGIGTGTTVHLRPDELPSGRVIVRLSKHYAAVIDGVLHDLADCSRHGTRAVYGYWTPRTKENT